MPKDAAPTAKNLRRKLIQSPLPGQTNLDQAELKSLKLPDKIPDDVHTLFVGINPGIRSATIGHYYAGHSNYFWKLLFASGIWPHRLKAEQDDLIVRAGFGLTDVVKRPTPGSSALSRSDFAASKERLQRIVSESRPEMVVFVSKTAIRAILSEHEQDVEYGLQEWSLDDSRVFLVPSTSGASLGHSSYEEKLEWFRALKREIDTYWSPSPNAPSPF